LICDTAAGDCVQCLSAVDCLSGQTCVANVCTGGSGAGGVVGAGGIVGNGGNPFAGGNGGVAGPGGSIGGGGFPGTGGGGDVCPAGNGAVASMRLKEVFIGAVDYLILVNAHASCSANVSGMMLSMRWTASDGGLDVTLPSLTLGPGQTLVVTEGVAQFGQVQAEANINWGATTAGYAMLCNGLCTATSGGSVVDLVSFEAGAAPPALPSPLTFTPLTTITTTNENTEAYLHVGSAGVYPAFLSSDWTAGAATFPPNGSCPGLPPRNGVACNTFGTSCTYGAVMCTCNIIPLPLWSCS
jgi:hypothetical protein